MNKSRIAGAIICLSLSALLILLNFALPADELMFTVGDSNMPFLPPIILGIVGLVLLFTAGIERKE